MNTIEDDFFDEVNIILDATIEGILIIKDGFIVNTNESFLNILAYDSKDELIGNLASGCLLPSSKNKFLKYNHNTFQEISLLSKNIDIIPAIIQIKDIKIKEKDFKMVSIVDLSELKKKEKMLLTQSRLAAMGEITSMISHQWKQPLTKISAVLANLKLKIAMKNIEENTFNRKINEINNYVQYMSKTIDDFTGFLQQNKTKEYINLQDLIAQAKNIANPSLNFRELHINIEKTKLNDILISRNLLLQVIVNIINNAKDALKQNEIKNPRIDISFKEDKNTQIIYIKDNAKGIDEKIKDKIFEPYFSTKKSLNGTGLGLYICKTIIEKNCNGIIEVSNIKDGCCFKIILSL